VAEGVEDSQTWAFLKDLGCDGKCRAIGLPRPYGVIEQWLDTELPVKVIGHL